MNELEHLLIGSPDPSDAPDGPPAPDPALDRLHALLNRRAQDQGLLDIAYRTLDSPVGRLLLAATPTGLVRVAYPGEDHEAVLRTLCEKVSPRILEAPARLDDTARQLEEYFTAGRRRFDLPLDLQLAHGFRRTVLQHLPEIAYGRTVSYARLAAAVGHPRASRAVGTACATNPLPLVIPCHRVVRSDGTAGAYIGGRESKLALLDLERPH